MKIYKSLKDAEQFLSVMMNGRSSKDEDVADTVKKIISDVRENGDEALRRYTEKFDGQWPEKVVFNRTDMKKAYDNADKQFCMALEKAKENIWEYHIKQKPSGYEICKKNGVILGETVRGLSRAALYVPGGRASYPSTVLMNAIPAKIAEVEEIIVLTPRGEDGKADSDILTASYIAGVDRIYLVGGAQAVAATAFGTELIPKADKIVGPGNMYVAEAKRALYGIIDIDMIAGPSEILIIADKNAKPAYIAADLMSQAEHDPKAAAVLLTNSLELAKRVAGEIENRLKSELRNEIIEESLKTYGGIVVCKDMAEMLETADDIAPEHLEIMLDAPLQYVDRIKNAGAIFLGENSPEPLGDYFSGTNHVLPTGGTARFSSPLGVESFIKRTEYTYYTKEQLIKDSEYIEKIAAAEGLFAHKAAITVRKERDCYAKNSRYSEKDG